MSRMQTPPTSYSHCPAHALSWGAWPLPGGCVSGGPGRLPLPQTVHPSCSHQWSWTPQTGTHASWAWCALKWSGKPMGVHKGRMNSTVVLSSGYGARGAEPNPQLWHHMTMWLYLLEPQFYLLYNGDFNSNNLIGLLWQLTNILSVLGSRLTEIIYLVYLADRYSMKVISYRFCYFLRSSVCLSIKCTSCLFPLAWSDALNPEISFILSHGFNFLMIPQTLLTTRLLLEEKFWQWAHKNIYRLRRKEPKGSRMWPGRWGTGSQHQAYDPSEPWTSKEIHTMDICTGLKEQKLGVEYTRVPSWFHHLWPCDLGEVT